MCWMYNQAISSAPCASLHGTKIAILEMSWSVMVIMELKPCDMGNFVIQSTAMVEKGVALCSGEMGNKGGLEHMVSALFAWQMAHPRTYCCTKSFILGHQ